MSFGAEIRVASDLRNKIINNFGIKFFLIYHKCRPQCTLHIRKVLVC